MKTCDPFSLSGDNLAAVHEFRSAGDDHVCMCEKSICVFIWEKSIHVCVWEKSIHVWICETSIHVCVCVRKLSLCACVRKVSICVCVRKVSMCVCVKKVSMCEYDRIVCVCAWVCGSFLTEPQFYQGSELICLFFAFFNCYGIFHVRTSDLRFYRPYPRKLNVRSTTLSDHRNGKASVDICVRWRVNLSSLTKLPI